MSTIPYNYGKYMDDKVAMSNSGTVDAGRQAQSPASAGSRGLAKTTQFTKDPTQMKMGNSPIAESMVEIRNILNRIDGVNVPVKEDNMQDLAIHDIEAQLGKINDEITFLQIDQKDKESALAALGELRSVLDKYQSQQESAVNELADDDKIEFTKTLLDISQIKDRIERLSVDDEAKKSAIQSLTNAEEALVALDETAGTYDDAGMTEDEETHPLWGDWGTTPQEWSDTHVANNDDMVMAIAKGQIPPKPVTLSSYFDEQNDLWPEGVEGGKYNDEQIIDIISDTVGYDCRSLGYDYLVKIRDGEVKGMYKPTPEQIKTAQEIIKNPEFAKARARNSRPIESVSEDEDELSRLKELSGIEEDTRTERRYTSDQIDQLKQWAKKYSQYKNIEGENLIEALYEYVFEMGIRQLAFEKGELQAAEKKISKAQEDWEDAEIEAAMEMSPISSGLMDDLENIIPGDVELEKKLDTIRTMLQKAGLKEDPYQPFPEADEITFEDDDAFYEAFGELAFPEDETELFDAEYKGRKVPLNKPMRGDVKKFKVYVKDPKTGNVKKVNFGHGGSSARRAGQKTMKIRKSNPKARKSFRARHNCANPGPKTKARYWSCRKW